MPFLAADTLPPEVEQLPKEAQSIWMSVFNSTFRTFSGDDTEKESAAFKAAWGAVKARFMRDAAGDWQRKAQLSFEDPPFLKSQFVRFVKFVPDLMEAKKRITLGEVYVPFDVDSHGDFADEETIEDGAYSWMAKYQQIGEQHQLFGGKGIVVENFISRKSDSEFPVPGTWVLGVQWSEDMWEKVLNGEVNGYSLAGKGVSVPLVAAQEYAKDVRLSKADGMTGELDEELFEKPQHDGPRVISQIIKLEPGEVSGVTTPATRQTFKLFKGETMNPRVQIVARKAEEVAPVPTPEEDPKAAPASPWLKLYNQLIADGYTPEEARKFTESVLGPAPPGTVTVEDQAESIGILRSLKSAIDKIAKTLGVTKAESTEDSPMTPQELERFNALEKNFGDLKSMIEKALAPAPAAAGEVAIQKCSCGGAAPVKEEEKKAAAAPASEELPAGVDLAQLNADVIEIAKKLLEFESRFEELASAPGVSGVEMALVPSEDGGAPIQKSAGYVSSSILGAPIPAGSRQAVVNEAIQRQERRNKRLERNSNIHLRMP